MTILFTSPTCQPCKQVKAEIPETLHVSIIDVFENPAEARKYGVRAAPTLIVEGGDAPLQKFSGAREILEYFASLK